MPLLTAAFRKYDFTCHAALSRALCSLAFFLPIGGLESSMSCAGHPSGRLPNGTHVKNINTENGTNFSDTAVNLFYGSLVLNPLPFVQTSSRTPCAPQLQAIFGNVLQQLLSQRFHHYASRCSRRYMHLEPAHARRKPMQPTPVTKVSCHFFQGLCANIVLCVVSQGLFQITTAPEGLKKR